MYETTNDFDFWGDYAADYAAAAVEEGFAAVEAVTERTEQGFTFFGGNGPTSFKTRTAKVRVTKEGFSRPGPCGPTAAVVGTVGYCPAEWVGA